MGQLKCGLTISPPPKDKPYEKASRHKKQDMYTPAYMVAMAYLNVLSVSINLVAKQSSYLSDRFISRIFWPWSLNISSP